MDLVISLVSWYKFLPPCLTWFHACACSEQFLMHIFLLALMDLTWSQVLIALVYCDIGCPVIEVISF
jgi:hypothetical protein